MGPKLLLLLLLGLVGQGPASSLPEVLQAPVGSSILVQCHYRLQDVKARKVEMVALREEDAGEYACVVEGLSGPQTMHRVTLDVLLAAPGLKEEEIHQDGTLGESSFLDSVNSGSPLDTSQDKKSRPWIWGAVFLLGLLVMVAAVLLAVMAKRKGNRFAVGGQFQSSGISNTAPSSVVHISDSGLAVDLPSDVPYVKLDSPPSFDDTTYTNLPPDSLSGKLLPLDPPCVPPLPPKVEISSKPVTYATVIFPGKGKSGEAPCEPAQEPPNSQTPPS